MTIQHRTNEGKLPKTRNEMGWRVYDVEALLKDLEIFDYPHFHLFAQEITKSLFLT
ncbi:hypothetical protein H8E77_41730 [bacterium]|nr:hypothetical protein [bacterium]